MGFIRIEQKFAPGEPRRWEPCSICTGSGTTGMDSEPTDRAWLSTEPSMACRGYRPTNLCPECDGAGGMWWPLKFGEGAAQ